MIHVIIASSFPIVLEGLKSILSRTADVNVVAEIGDRRQVLGMNIKRGSNVLIINLAIWSFENEFQILHQIRHSHTRLRVLVLSHQPEDQDGIYALRAGASGYLHLQCPPEELVLAVRKVASGRKYVSAALAELMAHRLDQTWTLPAHETLSVREWEVFLALASGKPLRRIAAEMRLSVKTISTYRARILEKMNMSSNADLMRYAIRNKLV